MILLVRAPLHVDGFALLSAWREVSQRRSVSESVSENFFITKRFYGLAIAVIAVQGTAVLVEGVTASHLSIYFFSWRTIPQLSVILHVFMPG